MLGTVREAGFTVVSSDDPADAIVVNTCGFLESSKEESPKSFVKPCRRDRGEAKRVVVAGCWSSVTGPRSWIGCHASTHGWVFDRDRVWMRSAGWIVSLFPMVTPPLLDQRQRDKLPRPRSRHRGLDRARQRWPRHWVLGGR